MCTGWWEDCVGGGRVCTNVFVFLEIVFQRILGPMTKPNEALHAAKSLSCDTSTRESLMKTTFKGLKVAGESKLLLNPVARMNVGYICFCIPRTCWNLTFLLFPFFNLYNVTISGLVRFGTKPLVSVRKGSCFGGHKTWLDKYVLLKIFGYVITNKVGTISVSH